MISVRNTLPQDELGRESQQERGGCSNRRSCRTEYGASRKSKAARLKDRSMHPAQREGHAEL